MTSSEIRKTFLDFFASRGHRILPSAPLVMKNDPTLMFTNAGMNQFKEVFLGISSPEYPRVADTQKCLRVSGKHNDLDEVGYDTYHHTFFEMLGNWSFGDYFKKEAIAWSWELLTEVYGLSRDRLYVTVFEGDREDGLPADQETHDHWKNHANPGHILPGTKEDNFWEMGDTGPCGPCTEIHIDLRPDTERSEQDGKELVNKDHPLVIEIWNNVFIQYNRKADGTLESLPQQHVDTGLGFERLCMVLQGKTSNYDTDVFQPLLQFIAKETGIDYQQAASSPPAASSGQSADDKSANQHIAMRVMADHVRAIAFTVADGQLPSNTGAGYVTRRILRRAVRYGFTFLGLKEPFLYKLVDVLAQQFQGVFDELAAQRDFIKKVIREEESSFLRTLAGGIQRFERYAGEQQDEVSGTFAFELYDTFGFPLDLTQLLAREKGLKVDLEGYRQELEKQKDRSRAATAVDTGDWTVLGNGDEVVFTGYDELETTVRILKYRSVQRKNKKRYQLVLDRTPFYPEGGGQVGDTGVLQNGGEAIRILDTKKEHNLIVHDADRLPENPSETFRARVDVHRRRLTANNHTATHLLHAALKQVLGPQVQQKGSLVNDRHLRFDFSHFTKVSPEELEQIEQLVNRKIRENIPLEERREVPFQQALEEGVTALFGEKYGDKVRVVTFGQDFSRELCGGTHAPATGQIGIFKITTESSVAAGVRRIEAVTADEADRYIAGEFQLAGTVRELLKNPKDVAQSLQNLLDENQRLKKEVEQAMLKQAAEWKENLIATAELVGDIHFIAAKVPIPSADAIKSLAYELRASVERLFLVLAAEPKGKAHLTVMISDELVKEKQLNAGAIVRELSKEIRGGGGGQPFYATAGGKDPGGIQRALDKAKKLLTADQE